MCVVRLTDGIRQSHLPCWLPSFFACRVHGERTVSLRGRHSGLWKALGLIAILCSVTSTVIASYGQDGVTVDDLATKTRIRPINVSPDGNHVAFLAVKGIPLRDRYEVTLYLRT